MGTTVIYTIGTSFSGSTFFSSALSLHPQMETVGQLHRSILAKNTTAICSCGKPLGECEFWSSVWARWHEQTKGSLDEFSVLIDRYEHMRHFMRVASDRAQSETFRKYFFFNQALFDAAAEVSGRRNVIDVSKYPVRGLALAKSTDMDIRFVHLVKSGPAFLSSVIKHSSNPKSRNHGHSKTFLYFRATRDWMLVNLQAERVIRVSHRPSIRVLYEDFVSQPERILAEIDERLQLNIGLKQTGTYLAKGGLVSFRHSTGNHVQYEGEAPIRVTDGWKKLLEPKAYYIFNALAGWLAKRYGYPLLWPK